MFIKFVKKTLNFLLLKEKKKFITVYPKKSFKRGRVLLSYLSKPLLVKDSDSYFKDHTNKWESKEISRIFNNLGYIVDVIDFDDNKFVPIQKYDIVFDIHYNLQRLIPFLDKNTIKILHITGSYPRFSVDAELKRVNDLEMRRGFVISPKRLVDTELFDRSLRFADYCTLIGNDNTLQTFPQKYINKITKIPVSSSVLDYKKTKNYFVPEKREFLWFFGGGAVHKGLDKVLDVFSKHKDLILNVIGTVQNEKDFCHIYKKELFETPNIKYHGYIKPSDKKFIDIIKNVFCFIAPSCSEGISPSVTTCLQLGLYPIISKNTGISLPNGFGYYLINSSVSEIEKIVLDVYSRKKEELEKQILFIQKYALEKYSRENFTKSMTGFIKRVVNDRTNKRS
ncbi:glycosyltransferase [Candidatus Dependentiae bacterium]|nr:glycosyltransferase [Candidatus Dependentiae bacterium]